MATTPDQENRRPLAASGMALTETRKQMLIDNLQLEITERARKLRAQYALQAQGLRTRLDMRINRIPPSLRQANMQDLLDKYSQPQSLAVINHSPHKALYPSISTNAAAPRGLKRPSDAMPDKENERPVGDIENPKKRVKTTAPISAVPIKPAARTTSRKPGPATVLSPKSHNSRTLPVSPFKTTSPLKDSALPKPSARSTTAASKATRPQSRQIKRPVAQPAATVNLTADNRPSSGSDVSSGTTIMVKRTAPATAATKKATTAAAGAPKSRTAGIKNALSSLTGSKRAATKKAAAAAPTASTATANSASTTTVGGRTLRKRG